jgi:hypothetical protein
MQFTCTNCGQPVYAIAHIHGGEVWVHTHHGRCTDPAPHLVPHYPEPYEGMVHAVLGFAWCMVLCAIFMGFMHVLP